MGLPPYGLAVGCAALVCLALLAVGARYYLGAAAFFRPIRRPITDADRRAVHEKLRDAREVSFRSSDGTDLRGFYVPPENGAVLVLGHGLGENRMRFLPFAEMLARRGYGCLFFDWRAHGDSGGLVSTWGDRERHDFVAAIDFASRQPELVAGRVAGLGFSIGASAVALAAAEDTRIRAVVLESVFPSFAEELKDKMGARGILSLWPARAAARLSGVEGDRIRPVESVARIRPRPVLFVAGGMDRDTPLPVMSRVYAAAHEPKQLWIAEGADHGEPFAVAPEEYERVIIDFLDRSLGAFTDVRA